MKHPGPALIPGLLLVAVACNPGVGELLNEELEFAKQICACADVECQTRVERTRRDWVNAWIAEHPEAAAKMGDKDNDSVEAARAKSAACREKLESKATPSR